MTAETKSIKLKWAVCDGFYAAETEAHTFELAPLGIWDWHLKVLSKRGGPPVTIVWDTARDAMLAAERVR